MRDKVTTIGACIIGYGAVLGGLTGLVYLIGLLEKVL